MREHRHMEKDVVARFTAEVEKRFYELHSEGTPLPYTVGTALSGQDADLADYLLAAKGCFALIEFKADRPACPSPAGSIVFRPSQAIARACPARRTAMRPLPPLAPARRFQGCRRPL